MSKENPDTASATLSSSVESEAATPQRALIIKPHWASLILSGDKTWEIRGSITNVRGTIGIIKSGSGLVYGTAVLTNCFQVTDEAFNQGKRNHHIPDGYDIPYKKRYVWELSSPKVFKEPIPYKHPQGAIIWVNLPKAIEPTEIAQSVEEDSP